MIGQKPMFYTPAVQNIEKRVLLPVLHGGA